jgi:hypothetical protein
MIPEFLARGSQRMWDSVQVRPSPAVEALAKKLTTAPVATKPPLEWEDPKPAGRVVMNAYANGVVYQAAGDQHIIIG